MKIHGRNTSTALNSCREMTSLGNCKFQDQDGSYSLWTMSSQPCLFKTLLPRGCWGLAEGPWPRTQRNLAQEARMPYWGYTFSGFRVRFTPPWVIARLLPEGVLFMLAQGGQCLVWVFRKGLVKTRKGGTRPVLRALVMFKAVTNREQFWAICEQRSDFRGLLFLL